MIENKRQTAKRNPLPAINRKLDGDRARTATDEPEISSSPKEHLQLIENKIT